MPDHAPQDFPHYLRVVRRGVPIGSIIDIGASDSQWSKIVRPYWPKATLMMLDGNAVHEPDLKAFAETNPPAHYRIAAAGPAGGKVKFFVPGDKFGGTVSLGMPGEYDVDQVTIDSLVAEFKLPPPYFIKLDTHGYELEIIEGAKETLRHTTLMQLEVYNFRIRKGVPVFPEMCFHMDGRGFRLADIFHVINRPSDGLMWQADALFEPKIAPWWKNDQWA